MAKKGRAHRRTSKRVIQHTPKRGTKPFVTDVVGLSMYDHLSAHIGPAACILLSLTVCQFVFSYNLNLDMDMKGVNILARLFSCGTMNLTAYNAVVLTRRFVVAPSFSIVERQTFRLLLKLGVITENGEMGLLDRVIHPQAHTKPNRSPAVVGAEVMSSLTIAGLALDYAANYTLLRWETMYAAFCIYGVLLLMEVSVFGFVRYEDGKPHKNRLLCMVLRVMVLMKLTVFGLTATECFAIMQRQYKLRHGDSSGIELGDDFSRFDTGEEDPDADAFEGEDSICPNLDAEAVSQLPSPSGGGGGYVRYAPGGIGEGSSLLNRWESAWGAKVRIFERVKHYFEGDQADEDRADPAAARARSYIPESCLHLQGLREWADNMFGSCKAIDGVKINQWSAPRAVASRITNLSATSQVVTEKPLVLVIVLLLPSFLGTMVPPLAIYDFPPGLITVDKSSLSNTLNILKALRGTAPYLLIVLLHNIRREWGNSIPAAYLMSDGLRFNLDVFLLVEPKAQFIFWFLWVIFWLLQLWWLTLIYGFGFFLCLTDLDGNIISGTVTQRRGATRDPLPSLEDKTIVHHRSKASYANAQPAPNELHTIDITLLRVQTPDDRELYDEMKAL